MKNDKTTNTLDEETLKKMKSDIGEMLSKDRYKILMCEPFIGDISMHFNLIPIRDARVATACTDYKDIYFDIDFYMRLKPEERIFVLAHEIWHSVQIHSFRRQSRDTMLWNIAADMEINNIIANDPNLSQHAKPAENLCWPPENMKNESAENLYDYLLKQAKKNKNKNKNGSDKGQDGQNGNNDSSGGSGGSSSGNNQTEYGNQFDKHEYGDSDDEKEGGSMPSDRWGEKGFDSDFHPQLTEEAAEKMREAAISSAQKYAREKGDLPAHIASVVGKLVKPEINWRQYLCSFVSSIPNGSLTWTPPNRRHVYNDTYFQSRRSEMIKGCVCIDTSGSTLGDLPKFFAELKGLVGTFGAYDITVIHCDAAVEKVDRYTYDENPLEESDFENMEAAGGGGTSFDPPFKYIEENGLDLDFCIYITDGYGDVTVDQPKYPVMWLVTKDGDMNFCDWGKKVRFKELAW